MPNAPGEREGGVLFVAQDSAQGDFPVWAAGCVSAAAVDQRVVTASAE